MAINIIQPDPHASRPPFTITEARDFSRELSKRIAATDNRIEKAGYLAQFHRRCIVHRTALSNDKQCSALMDAYALYEVGKL